MKKNRICSAFLLIALAAAGCVRVGIEGGEKPIHIVMDVNVRVARELDDFFAFEDQTPSTTTDQPDPAQAPAAVIE